MGRILAAGESPYELDGEWLRQAAPEVVLTQDLCYFCEVDAGTVRRAVAPISVPPPGAQPEPADAGRDTGQLSGRGRGVRSAGTGGGTDGGPAGTD